MFSKLISSYTRSIIKIKKTSFFSINFETKRNLCSEIFYKNNINIKEKTLNFSKITSKNFSIKKLPNLRKYGEIKINFKNLINDLPLHISNIKNRKVSGDIVKVISLYHEYMKKLDDINLMRRQLNEMKNLSKEVAKSGKSVEQLSKDQKKHNQDIVKFQDELSIIENNLMTEALKIPNLTHPNSPVGDESQAKLIKIVGKMREFDFKPLDHLEIGEKYDLFDFENASKITGSKFVILKNQAAILEQALINYGISKIITKGFTFITTPDICKNTIIEGCGFNPRDENSCIYFFYNFLIFYSSNL